MSMDTRKTTEVLFDTFADHLAKHLEKICFQGNTEGSKEESLVENFDRSLHWHKLGLCFQSISKECTKLAVGYSKPPAPDLKECQLLIDSLKEAINVLWAWFDAFPLSEGKALHLELAKLVHSLLEAIQAFILSIKVNGPSESHDRLQKTGKVWEYCELFEKVSKDNKSAAGLRLLQAYQLADDAFTELKEELSIDDNDPENESWTDQDKPLFEPCLGLIESAKKTLKMIESCIKVKGDVKDQKSIEQFDFIVEMADKISPSVDDLVLSLYPPVDHTNVLTNAKLLASTLEEIIQASKSHHYMEEKYFHWLDGISNDLKNRVSVLCELP
ncbi:cyclin-D1-binding protein 1 homolog [Rhopilema esculentum]|uniref:cyclin-D1-binding protein 1 homolog n=1 Tax=Rhopilema esculentum TaxID=499914 RepID=UPI0031DC703A